LAGSRAGDLLAPVFHPALEINQRERAFVLGRLLESAVI
jgi:hypothetical protein